MIPNVSELSDFLDRLSGIQGTLGYVVIASSVFLGYLYVSSSILPKGEVNYNSNKQEEEEEEEDVPRNFTKEQLRYFDGSTDEKSGETKPLYMSVGGTVFDVSGARNFYGPDAPYGVFAGRECGVALAKMSFDEKYLDDLEGIDSLSFGEKTELEGWIDKFTNFRVYPIKGRYIPSSILPSGSQVMTAEDLRHCDGSQKVPDQYATPPILIGAGEYVFDVSFGGTSFYGKGGPYHVFAGRDASRALGKMSLDVKDAENSDTSDFTEKEIKILNDWIKTFKDRKRYPVVGRLKKQ